jgi:hypothetical protein
MNSTTALLTLVTGGLWVLALARVTRLLTQDEITDFIRVWVYGRWGKDSSPGYFATCPWCVSMWLGFAFAWIVWLPGGELPGYLYPLIALTGSYLVGLMASNLEPDEDIDVEIMDE